MPTEIWLTRQGQLMFLHLSHMLSHAFMLHVELKFSCHGKRFNQSCLQDAPPGSVLLVTASKCASDNCRVLCLRCFYIKRGSFAKLTLMEFLTMLYTVKALFAKLLIWHFLLLNALSALSLSVVCWSWSILVSQRQSHHSSGFALYVADMCTKRH